MAPEAPGGRAPRTLRLVLAYEGTEYAGWQVQREAPTIQGKLLAAARRLDAGARVTGASRTDAGVHALRQVASLDVETSLPAEAILRALNATLPRDIRVGGIAEARPGFSARREATGKRYAYLIDGGAVASPLLRRFAWHLPRALDVGAMRGALAVLRGR